MIFYEKYDQFAIDTNNYINLRVINNKNLSIFEWPEEIGPFEFVKDQKYIKLICYGNRFTIHDTTAEYTLVPYCGTLIDTNTCTIKTKVLVKETFKSARKIKKYYDKTIYKSKEIPPDEYSKYDELNLVKFCYDITFSILNGRVKYIPLFYSLINNFPVLIYGLDSEDYSSCRAAIEHIVTHKRIEIKIH